MNIRAVIASAQKTLTRKTEERDRKLTDNETNLRHLFGTVPSPNELRQAYEEKVAVLKTEQTELRERVSKLKSTLESKRSGQKIHQERVDSIEDELRKAEAKIRKVTRGVDFATALKDAKDELATQDKESGTLEFFTQAYSQFKKHAETTEDHACPLCKRGQDSNEYASFMKNVNEKLAKWDPEQHAQRPVKSARHSTLLKVLDDIRGAHHV